MELKTAELNGALVARLAGRFDAHEVPQVRAWFDARKPARAIVDLSGATFLDSAALSLLVQQMKHCRERGGDLALCGLAQPVRIIFELTRLDRAFRIAPDEAGALAALTAA
jgi:anti-sigma B factor antagonist